MSFCLILNVLADLGINQFTARRMAAEPETGKDWFSRLFSFKVLLTLLFPVVITAIAALFRPAFLEGWALQAIAFSVGVSLTTMFFRACFQAYQRYAFDAVASILEKTLLLAAVWLLLLLGITVQSYLAAMLGASLLALGILIWMGAKILGFPRPDLRGKDMRQIVGLSYGFMIINILDGVNNKVDQLLLQEISGDLMTGLYAGAYRWLDSVMMYLWTVLPILFARFAAFGRDEDATGLLKFGQVLAGGPMIFIGLLGMAYPEIFLFQFRNTNPAHLAVMISCFRILFGAAVINGLVTIYSTFLSATGREKVVSTFVLSSILLNTVLNLTFIPEHGPIAAAWTTLCSFACLGIAYLIYTATKTQVQIPWHNLGQLSSMALIGGGLMFGCQYFEITWYFATGLLLLIFVFMAYFFRFHAILLSRGE